MNRWGFGITSCNQHGWAIFSRCKQRFIAHLGDGCRIWRRLTGKMTESPVVSHIRSFG
jgi:hypothetical protein